MCGRASIFFSSNPKFCGGGHNNVFHQLAPTPPPPPYRTAALACIYLKAFTAFPPSSGLVSVSHLRIHGRLNRSSCSPCSRPLFSPYSYRILDLRTSTFSSASQDSNLVRSSMLHTTTHLKICLTDTCCIKTICVHAVDDIFLDWSGLVCMYVFFVYIFLALPNATEQVSEMHVLHK